MDRGGGVIKKGSLAGSPPELINSLTNYTPPLSNKKASNKKLDSQISYFNRISRDLITKSNKNLLLKIKKSRLSLEKSSFLLDGRECTL